MSIYLEKVREPLEIPKAFKAVVGEGAEAYRFMDSSVYDEGKGYNTYKLVSEKGEFVLKKSSCQEDYESEVKHYSLLEGLPVPRFLGASEGCILMSFVEGDDLKEPTDSAVRETVKSLVRVMNAYPMGREYERERYETYIRRLEKRAKYLENEPELKRAFALFYERQKEIPLTLSNGDLLPINVLYDGKKATLIDWGFGGFLPYALDIARFTAHSTGSGEVTSFRMSDAQKKLFSQLVYEGLSVKPAKAVYERDLLLARFNECVEILEYYLNDPEAVRDRVFEHYYPMAKMLANEITANQ